MNRTACLFAFALAACVDSGCPQGSDEVNGTCMSVGSASRGDGGIAGSSGGDAAFPDAHADAHADGGETRDVVRVDSGASSDPDAAPGAGCDELACDEHARCDDSGGAAMCVCEPGFGGNGTTCTDQDECVDGSAQCAATAACQNEIGGFSCTCEPGFEGDGTTCEPNPCEPRVNPCDEASSTCRAGGGAVVCDCLAGLASCDGDRDACEVDTRSDAAHCGACDAACAGDLACREGACEQAVVQLALGLEHSCALAADGDVLCWGQQDAEQLGREDSSSPPYEPTPTRFGKARWLAAGHDTNCAISRDHELVCWGDNTFNWIAPGADRGAFSLASALVDVEQVALGNLGACVLAAGHVRCWGVYSASEGLAREAFATRPVIRIPDAASLSGGLQVCALTEDATVYCWTDQAAAPRPGVDVNGTPLADVRHVASGTAATTVCAALNDGRAVCWGDNAFGQLGNPAAAESGTSHAVTVTDELGNNLDDILEVSVGREHACALESSGRVWCWGRSDRVGRGASSSTAQPFATPVRGLDDAVEVAAGGNHACVRRRSGQVQCWGDNSYGQLGVAPGTTGSARFSSVPVNVLGLP